MRINLGLCCLFLGQLLLSQTATAQEIRQTIRDYCTDKPFTYAPCDPWTRGKVFNLQTGNAGLFYNCDGEEDKRNSPYICWKTHHEKDLPPRRGLWRGLKMDVEQVRQRIRDGAGACCPTGCRCLKCAKKNKIQASRCPTCQVGEVSDYQGASFAAARPAEEPAEIENGETANAMAQAYELTTENETIIPSAPKFGLLKGNSVRPQTREAIQPAVEQPKSRFAKKIEQLIQKR